MSDRQSSVIDLEFLDEFTQGDLEFEKEIIQLFIDNSSKNIDDMVSALEDGDNDKWYKSSHLLKGSSGAIGAWSFMKLAENGQKAKDQPKSEKVKILDQIRKNHKVVVDFISKRIDN